MAYMIQKTVSKQASVIGTTTQPLSQFLFVTKGQNTTKPCDLYFQGPVYRSHAVTATNNILMAIATSLLTLVQGVFRCLSFQPECILHVGNTKYSTLLEYAVLTCVDYQRMQFLRVQITRVCSSYVCRLLEYAVLTCVDYRVQCMQFLRVQPESALILTEMHSESLLIWKRPRRAS